MRVAGLVLGRVAPPLAFSVVVVVAWQIGTMLTGVSALLLPSPADVLRSLGDKGDLFASNALVTLGEIVVGFVLGGVVGLGLGLLLAYSRIVRRSLYPWLVASQMIPIIAVAPILVVWFGFTMAPKVLVVALVSFFPVVVNTNDGLQSVDRDMVNLMRTFGASSATIMRMVRLPAALPFVFSGLKVAIALSVVGAVFGEWVGSSSGLGYLMLVSNNQLATVDLFAEVIVLSAMGIALFFVVGVAERLIIPWHHEQSRSD